MRKLPGGLTNFSFGTMLGRQAVGVKSNEEREEEEEEEEKEDGEKENRSLNLNTNLPGLLVKGNSHGLLSVKHV